MPTDIEIDGGITPETARLAWDAGANVFVAGTAIFGAPGSPHGCGRIEKGSTGEMSERVLIADDDPDILQVVKINLELEGYDVETAADGVEAVDKATSDPPQLILLDIMMPGMDGLTALRRIRAHGSTGNTSIILLTARGLPEDRVRGLELGADDYITKPFDVSELVARVMAVLRRTQAARDLSRSPVCPGTSRIGQEIEKTVTSGRACPWSAHWTSTTSRLSTTTMASCVATRSSASAPLPPATPPKRWASLTPSWATSAVMTS